MTDDETEFRLRAALRHRAGLVDPHLSGPELRRRAAGSERGRVRRFAPALAAAAAVVVIATVSAVIGADDPQRGPMPVPPGQQRTASVTAPVPSPSSIAATTSPVRPSLVAPSASTSGTASPTSRPVKTAASTPSR